ncbi:MAG: hypothetical protein Q9209_003759 [Squamulea sp. 1 TL-2023]
MPVSSSITIAHLAPPGSSILSLPHSLLSSLTKPEASPPTPPKDFPSLFLAAICVRIPVFITEQRCSIEGEIDADDARSWHWIAFDGDLPVATLRLVPVSIVTTEVEGKKEEVMVMEKEHVDLPNNEGRDRRSEPYHGATKIWDGREPYIKIGRMATLASYRGRGIAQTLIEESLSWAASHAAHLSSQVGIEPDGTLLWTGLVLSHAQKSVAGWWTKMGFEVDDGLGVWWEEGIEHVGMWRRVTVEEESKGVVETG